MENKRKKEQVLSHDEIDQLLRAINAGNTEPEDFRPAADSRKIKIYDFKRPDRFSKDDIRGISFNHELINQSWIKMFAKYINTENIKLEVASIDQLTLEEFIRSIPTPTALIISKGKLNSTSMPLSFVIEMDPELNKEIVNYCTLENIGILMLDEYSKVLSKQYDLSIEFELNSILTIPDNINIAPRTEMGLLITIEAALGNSQGMINIFLPYPFIKPLLPYMDINKKENIIFNKESDNMTERNYTKPEIGLDNVNVQVAVELGRSIITMKEAKGIGEGSIIALDKLGGEPVDIFINNVLLGKGEVCVVDENFAVRVTELIEENNINKEEVIN